MGMDLGADRVPSMRTEYVRLGVVADCPGCLRCHESRSCRRAGDTPRTGTRSPTAISANCWSTHEYCQAVAPFRVWPEACRTRR